jgi:hypothetical protein
LEIRCRTGEIYRVDCAALVPASACQISSSPDFFVIASWTCLPPTSPVMSVPVALNPVVGGGE